MADSDIGSSRGEGAWRVRSSGEDPDSCRGPPLTSPDSEQTGLDVPAQPDAITSRFRALLSWNLMAGSPFSGALKIQRRSSRNLLCSGQQVPGTHGVLRPAGGRGVLRPLPPGGGMMGKLGDTAKDREGKDYGGRGKTMAELGGRGKDDEGIKTRIPRWGKPSHLPGVRPVRGNVEFENSAPQSSHGLPSLRSRQT